MKRNKKYNWAIARNGRIVRESDGRRAIYQTRDAARMALKFGWVPRDAKVVRRDEVTNG